MHDPAPLKLVVLLLLAAVIFAPIFHRFRISPVLAYLAAGVCIIPLAGLIGLEIDVKSIRYMAEFGVVFMLFVIGLEMSVEKLRAQMRMVFGMGGMQVVVTGTLIGLIAFHFFGMNFEQSVIIGGALALSSTAMVLKILSDRRELSAPHGRNGFSILLMQDLAIVPLLMLVPLFTNKDQSVGVAVSEAFVKSGVALLVVLGLGRFVLRPLFRIIAHGRVAELFTCLVLLSALGIGLVTELLGLSMALGAFLAGLMLSETEYKHQIEAEIEPFKGLLLGLFFMAVGMSIDLSFVPQHLPQILTVLAMLLGLKFVLIVGIARLFGISLPVAVHMGIILAQGGEFAFILFGQAQSVGMIVGETYQTLMAAVAISMALTPTLFFVGRLAGRALMPRRDDSPQFSVDDLADANDGMEGHVVICGFGRVGQTISKLLEEFQVAHIAMDLDTKRVATGRGRGFNVYYGDTTRMEIMKSTGLAQARAVIVTLDNREHSVDVVKKIHKDYPDTPIIARAVDVEHAQKLEEAGATNTVPEMLEGSLHLGAVLLERMDQTDDEIDVVIDRFRANDYERLGELIPATPPRAPRKPLRRKKKKGQEQNA
ncbi:MAG: glutathione-regulated potassium-efflux system protein KefB [Alphaproteobacteria bacterium]